MIDPPTTSVVTISSLPATPWANGGGTTRELLSWPPGAADSDWRVSVADIVADGPFSVLPGVDRIITVTDGDGFRLRGAGVDQAITTPYAPFAFDGGLPLDCRLAGRPSTALNVMARRGRGSATVDLLRGPSTTASLDHGVLVGLTGEWLVGSDRLTAGQAWWWTGRRHRWRVLPSRPTDLLALISWHPACG